MLDARVAELADATDLKSVELTLRAGSSPATSTTILNIAEWSSW